MSRISESKFLAVVAESKDYGSAGVTTCSVNMGGLHSVAFEFNFGAITGNSTLIFYASAARATTTTALPFYTRLGSAVFSASGNNSADQWGARTLQAATGITLTAATYQHKQLVCEFDSDFFQSSPSPTVDKQPWLNCVVSSAATVLLMGITLVGNPRYPGNLIPTLF